MKILVWLGRIFLGLVLLIALVIAGIYGWWRLGDWQDRAVRDVTFVHDTILNHHPGPVDPENPEFRTLMDEAFINAMVLAETARSPADHHAALDAYTDTFNDGHLSVFFAENALRFLNSGGSGAPTMTRTSTLNVTDNRAWIRISSFVEQASPIAALTTQIEAEADTLRTLDTIVFDLRGNSGGNSAFGTRIVRALWTQDVYNDWVPSSAAGVDWRASAANAEHVHGIAQQNADRGREASAAAWRRVAESIDAAVAAGEDYARQDFSARETTRTAPIPVTAQIIVITDRRCASACLDFMDKVRAMPNVIHVGAETSSDTQYIDVRFAALPSRTGALIIPLKVYRDRLRPPGGTYVPDIEVDPETLYWNTLTQILED